MSRQGLEQGSEMRHRPDIDTDEAEERGEAAEKEEGGKRRIDLSVAQVSGSALAAVIAAKLASTLGVYGTILGAGVISVIATCGGPLFQHLFRRTGEQVRDATVAAKPKARQVPLAPGPQDDRTLMLGTVRAPDPYVEELDEEFGAATTHGTRVRGWKRPAIAAALVFGVTMGGITTYELVSGQDFSGTHGTTTFGSVVRGGGSSGQDGPPAEDKDPSPAPSGSADGTARPDDGAGSPSTGGTPTPGEQDTGQNGTATPSPEPTPSGSTDGEATPTPTPTPTAPTTEPTAPTEEPTTGTGQPEPPSAPAPAGAGAGADAGTEQ
ncbi:hypothetical protein [Streptomyces sp. NBC_00572]|uniref:hypothetical protein n=1 Tax=Streptomyces sp. NBC_00572 TaxID=2903664 RepID=UPI002251E712|nr:hypothetical protein [Streptomyces sp. NBC_00572]MCX4984016.1 hypothetical protein [Streptomyces sp. NBC_00572]